MAGELTTALFNSGRYDVLDRQNLDKMLAEQQLTAASLSDADSAAKAGKILGASALVVGTVTRHDYREGPVKYERFEKPADNNTKEQWIRYTRGGVGTVNATFRVTDLATGKIIASRTISEESAAETTREAPYGASPEQNQPDPIDGDGALAKARSAVIARFMKAIAPFYDHLDLPFQTTGDLPELEKGVASARANDWLGASAAFSSAVGRSAPLPPKKRSYAHFDLGMALCFGLGDFEKGLAEIRAASELHEDSDYAQVTGMCQERAKDAAKLAAQGVGQTAGAP
jgi:hypothetical protein